MPDDLVNIFESADNAIVRAVETALTRARIAFELRRVRPTLGQMGPKKPPQPLFVAAEDEAAAREVVEVAIRRRARVASLHPKPSPASGIADNGGGAIGVYGFDFGSGDFSGGD